MVRRLKFLGLVVVAIGALTAVASASASAASFHSESVPSWLKGEQGSVKNVFTVSGGTVKCTGAEFKSKESLKTTSETTVAVVPTYTGCTAFGSTAVVTTTGCEYELTASSKTVGAVKIVCSGSSKITVKDAVAACEVTVAGQTPGTPEVGYTDEGTGTTASVLVTAKVKGITYSSTGGACGASGTTGEYTGTVLTKGYKEASFGVQQGIKVE